MATNAWNNYYGSLPQFLIDPIDLTIGTSGGTYSVGAVDTDLTHRPYSGFVCTDIYNKTTGVGEITTTQKNLAGTAIKLKIPVEGIRWTFTGGDLASFTNSEIALGCFCPDPCKIGGNTFQTEQLGAGAAKRVRQVNQAGQSETLIGGGSFNNTTWPGQGI